MGEVKFGAARLYKVTFEVAVKYEDIAEAVIEQREVYYMKRMSAKQYEADYLGKYMHEGTRGTGEIVGARAIDVKHFAGQPY